MPTAQSKESINRTADRSWQADEPESARDTTASFGLWPWVELARRNHMPIEHFCELAGVELTALRDPGMRFSQRVTNRVAEVAYEQFGEDAAMAAAQTVEAGQFNLLELVARSAPTVADGLEAGCRFFPLLHSGGRLTEEVAADGSHTLRWSPPVEFEVHRGYVELTFAVALRGIRRETGQDALVPREVWFRHAAPAELALYEEVLGPSVRFAMPNDRMVLGADMVELPLTRHNREIHAAAARVAKDLLDD